MKHAIQKYHKVASTTLELMIAPDPVLRYPDPSRPRGLLRHHGAIIHRAGFGYFEARGWRGKEGRDGTDVSDGGGLANVSCRWLRGS